jgi:hypothetical protein
MAKVGVVASILGIANLGVKLALAPCDLGSTASSTREHSGGMARNVTLFSNVLELLAGCLENDELIHSEAALNFAEERLQDSNDLFQTRRGSLPYLTA